MWTGCHYLGILVGYLCKVICVFVIILPCGEFEPNSHCFIWNNLPSQPQIFMTLNFFFFLINSITFERLQCFCKAERSSVHTTRCCDLGWMNVVRIRNVAPKYVGKSCHLQNFRTCWCFRNLSYFSVGSPNEISVETHLLPELNMAGVPVKKIISGKHLSPHLAAFSLPDLLTLPRNHMKMNQLALILVDCSRRFTSETISGMTERHICQSKNST